MRNPVAQVQSVSFRSPGRSHPYLYTIVEALSCQSEWLSATHRAERARASIACGTLVNTRSSRRDTLGSRATAGQDPSHRSSPWTPCKAIPCKSNLYCSRHFRSRSFRRVGGEWGAVGGPDLRLAHGQTPKTQTGKDGRKRMQVERGIVGTRGGFENEVEGRKVTRGRTGGRCVAESRVAGNQLSRVNEHANSPTGE